MGRLCAEAATDFAAPPGDVSIDRRRATRRTRRHDASTTPLCRVCVRAQGFGSIDAINHQEAGQRSHTGYAAASVILVEARLLRTRWLGRPSSFVSMGSLDHRPPPHNHLLQTHTPIPRHTMASNQQESERRAVTREPPDPPSSRKRHKAASQHDAPAAAGPLPPALRGIGLRAPHARRREGLIVSGSFVRVMLRTAAADGGWMTHACVSHLGE